MASISSDMLEVRRIPSRMSSLVATTALMSIPVTVRTSSSANTLAGSDIATTSLPSS